MRDDGGDDGERAPGVVRQFLQPRQPVGGIAAVPVGGVHHQEIGVRVGEGERREQLDPPAGRQLLGPQPGDVVEAVDLEPGVAEQGAPVAARHQGQVLGDEVADAQVLFGLVDAGGVDHGARLPEHLDPGTSVPARRSPPEGFMRPLRARARAVRWSWRMPSTSRRSPARGLQRGGRQQVVPPAGHGELLYAEQGGPFAETMSTTRLTKLTGQFK